MLLPNVEYLIEKENYVQLGTLVICTLTLGRGYKIVGEGDSPSKCEDGIRIGKALARAVALRQLQELERYHVHRMRQRDLPND
jgi:hypothetical protein